MGDRVHFIRTESDDRRVLAVELGKSRRTPATYDSTHAALLRGRPDLAAKLGRGA